MDIRNQKLSNIIKFLTLILFASHIVSIEAASSANSYRYPVPTCDQMINALDGIVKYYEKNYKLVIFDAYYGLVRSEDYIRATIRNYQKGVSTLSKQQFNHLQRIYNRIVTVAGRIRPILANQSIAYSFLSKLTKPTSIPKQLVELNFTKVYKVSSDANISPTSGYMNISDMCIRGILGTRKMNQTKCHFSDSCWAGITNYHGGFYGITHQLLSIFAAEQQNCTQKMKVLAKNWGGLDRIKQVLCTQIYHQVQKELKQGLKNSQIQDLFLEQLYVCGGKVGYRQFLKPDYLSMILNWQTKAGCFAPYHGVFISLHPNLTLNHTNGNNSRSLPIDEMRANLITSDGCYEHRTSIALSLIASYLLWDSVRNQPLQTPTSTQSTDVGHRGITLSIAILGVTIVGVSVIIVFIVILTMYFLCPLRRTKNDYQQLQSTE